MNPSCCVPPRRLKDAQDRLLWLCAPPRFRAIETAIKLIAQQSGLAPLLAAATAGIGSPQTVIWFLFFVKIRRKIYVTRTQFRYADQQSWRRLSYHQRANSRRNIRRFSLGVYRSHVDVNMSSMKSIKKL